MEQNYNIAQQGNLFESATQVINPATKQEQPLFAMTKGNWAVATPAMASQIATELASPRLHAIVKEVQAIEDEDEQKAKKKEREHDIPGLCPHYSQFRNNHRAAADAIPESCTYVTCVDVDDRSFGQQAIDGAKRLTEQQGTKWYGKVL